MTYITGGKDLLTQKHIYLQTAPYLYSCGVDIHFYFHFIINTSLMCYNRLIQLVLIYLTHNLLECAFKLFVGVRT